MKDFQEKLIEAIRCKRDFKVIEEDSYYRYVKSHPKKFGYTRKDGGTWLVFEDWVTPRQRAELCIILKAGGILDEYDRSIPECCIPKEMME